MDSSNIPPHLSEDPEAELANLRARAVALEEESAAIAQRMRELLKQIGQRQRHTLEDTNPHRE